MVLVRNEKFERVVEKNENDVTVWTFLQTPICT